MLDAQAQKRHYGAFSWVFLFISLWSSLSWAEKADTPEFLTGTTRITAEQLIDLVDESDDLVIIDSRKTEDRAAGFIEGSIGLVNTDTTPEVLAEHLSSKKTPVIFYCNGPKCGRSYEAAKIAIAAGYQKIYWFRGGWEEWLAKEYPVSK